MIGRSSPEVTVLMAAARIDKGSVFRGIGRWGMMYERALDPILKQRAEMAGLERAEFSAMVLVGLSDGGRQSRHFPARGNGTVATPLGAA